MEVQLVRGPVSLKATPVNPESSIGVSAVSMVEHQLKIKSCSRLEIFVQLSSSLLLTDFTHRCKIEITLTSSVSAAPCDSNIAGKSRVETIINITAWFFSGLS